MPKRMQQNNTSQWCIWIESICIVYRICIECEKEGKREREKSVYTQSVCISLKVCGAPLSLCCVGLMPDFDSLWYLFSCSLIFCLATNCQRPFLLHIIVCARARTYVCAYEQKTAHKYVVARPEKIMQSYISLLFGFWTVLKFLTEWFFIRFESLMLLLKI